ncbi:unnamed protein product [Calypogeia fissa]
MTPGWPEGRIALSNGAEPDADKVFIAYFEQHTVAFPKIDVYRGSRSGYSIVVQRISSSQNRANIKVKIQGAAEMRHRSVNDDSEQPKWQFGTTNSTCTTELSTVLPASYHK